MPRKFSINQGYAAVKSILSKGKEHYKKAKRSEIGRDVSKVGSAIGSGLYNYGKKMKEGEDITF